MHQNLFLNFELRRCDANDREAINYIINRTKLELGGSEFMVAQ
jgi:hypothetical protein